MTLGEKIADAMFALVDREKLSGKAGALARAELRPKMARVIDELLRKNREKRVPKVATAEMPELWAEEAKQSPAFASIDPVLEWHLCRDRCLDEKQPFSHRRYKTWLRNAVKWQARDMLAKAPGGQKVAAALKRSQDLTTEPFGWRITLLRIYPGLDKAAVAAKAWADLSPSIKQDVLRSA